MSVKWSEKIQFWWVTASENNPRPWHWRNFFKDNDPAQGYNWGGPDWINSTVSFARIKNMKWGDIVVAYQASEGVVGLAYLDSDGYQKVKGGHYDTFDLKTTPTIWLKEPVSFQVIRDSPNAKGHIEFVSARRGTVFGVSPTGFNIILELILKVNPSQSKKIHKFLSVKPPVREAEVIAVDDTGGLKPTRKATLTIQRVVRDSAVGKSLKRLYEYECQVCGMTIELPNGRRYAEVHHLRPVGKPHNGKDGMPNTIVVCPLHHAMLDLGAIAIDPQSLIVEHWNQGDRKVESTLILKHRLDKASLIYHYHKLFKGTK